MTERAKLELIPPPQPHSRIFGTEVLRKLAISNRCIRWLRAKKIRALRADVIGATWATVIVPAGAAEVMRSEAHKRNLRCYIDAAGGTLFVDECAVTWRI